MFRCGVGAARSMTSSAPDAAARPKTTRSISEFDPRRFAPCTEAQPASPTAINPGITRSGLELSAFEHLTPIVHRNAAHVVMDSRRHTRIGSRVTLTPAKIFALSEMPGRHHAKRPGRDGLDAGGSESLFLPTPRPSRILQRHAARNDVARGKILGRGRVASMKRSPSELTR